MFCDRGGLGAQLAARLGAQGLPVIVVEAGSVFTCAAAGAFVVNPSRADDYVSLLRAIADDPRPAARTLSRIVHLWSVDDSGDAHDPAALARAQELGFYSLLYLAQAMATEDVSGPLNLTVVGSQVTAGFYIRNMFNKKYFGGGNGSGPGSGSNAAVPGVSRMFGGELGIKF